MELLELELVPVILAVQSSHENLQEMFLLSTYLKKLRRKKKMILHLLYSNLYALTLWSYGCFFSSFLAVSKQIVTVM